MTNIEKLILSCTSIIHRLLFTYYIYLTQRQANGAKTLKQYKI